MSVRRLSDIPGFNIDRVAAAAGGDPEILRLENLDTDVPPPREAVDATREAIGTDEANSWLPAMRDRTVTIGCPTLEQRMIAWRIGWIVAPGELANDVSRVHIYNGLVPSGFNQIGARVALTLADDGLAAANVEWQRRRDETLRQLADLPAVRPAGGWSLLLDVAALGLDCVSVSERLLEQKVAATPMRGWGGQVADRHVRFVFSNEPVERLALLGERLRAALADA